MFNEKFRQLLNDYPDAVSNHRKLSGLLRDIFPQNTKQIRLLLYLHELGIHNDIANTRLITNQFTNRFKTRLVDEYGVSDENAIWGVLTWCKIYGDILGIKCETFDLIKEAKDVKSKDVHTTKAPEPIVMPNPNPRFRERDPSVNWGEELANKDIVTHINRDVNLLTSIGYIISVDQHGYRQQYEGFGKRIFTPAQANLIMEKYKRFLDRFEWYHWVAVDQANV